MPFFIHTKSVHTPLNDKLYLNPHIINKIIGSDGLAAGNTLEEAIVQGLSEIYEHYVTD